MIVRYPWVDDMSEHFSASDLKTAGKLFILRQYLKPYLTIIREYWDYVVYVDTHAGSGKSTVFDDTVTLRGSPLLAMDEDTKGGFDEFVLFETDPERFEKLTSTIEEEYGYTLDRKQLSFGSKSYKYALCENPKIRVLQVNSNVGVQIFAKESSDDHHWFTFVDPELLVHLDGETIDSLIERGNMDILINFHTTGVKRAAAADQARERAERYTGIDGLPEDLSLEEYAQKYCDELHEANPEWNAIHKPMIDPRNPSYQFDMVFTSANKTARKIVNDIMSDEDFWSRSRSYLEEQRDEDDPSQSGLDDFF